MARLPLFFRNHISLTRVTLGLDDNMCQVSLACESTNMPKSQHLNATVPKPWSDPGLIKYNMAAKPLQKKLACPDLVTFKKKFRGADPFQSKMSLNIQHIVQK